MGEKPGEEKPGEQDWEPIKLPFSPLDLMPTREELIEEIMEGQGVSEEEAEYRTEGYEKPTEASRIRGAREDVIKARKEDPDLNNEDLIKQFSPGWRETIREILEELDSDNCVSLL